MFDIGASEFLLVIIVAIVVIGPKDLPLALRTAGRWIAKIRRVSGHFRSGIETMIREAELEEMERKWRDQNEAIMRDSPPLPADVPNPASAEAHNPASAEAGATASAQSDTPADTPDVPAGAPPALAPSSPPPP